MNKGLLFFGNAEVDQLLFAQGKTTTLMDQAATRAPEDIVRGSKIGSQRSKSMHLREATTVTQAPPRKIGR